ncbi:L,D-transpeptidase family protein [Paracraurococcus lichenis]|uniref:L,D-transpeptidase family protein n=1 Tax=Paracraurococcus lichenis TaxID=3064888 RepID=A0ABT9DST8_9PROT|nr:L,D-transpeptidase family protein [Paracraurococcus sp. LOR1-02]MDO9706941.1 L,D-transpeptidase family protein [Paracraurococcus sp. LOR1-02]
MRTLLALTLLGAAGLALPPAHAKVPASQAVMHAVQGTEALLRLAARLRRLTEDGLDPRDYAIPADTLAEADPAAWRAALKQAAGAAVSDLLHGKVRDLPGRVDLRRDTAALPLAPWMAELSTAPEPATVIDRAALLPPEAAALKRALAAARARAAAGGLPTVPPMPGTEALEPGTVDPVRVPALRARLAATDPAVAAMHPEDPLVYDEALVAALRRFQAAEALEPDGRIGRMTFAALNRPAEVTIRQLRVALDMRRAAAAPGAERRIEVNIPHQRLQVIEAGRVLLDMNVIVGKPARATPVLRTRLAAVMFNPPWGVPERNAREDLLPKFRTNARAMMEKGFRVFGFADGQRIEIDPTTIDWRSVTPERFPYLIRQDAGEANALGRIKFVIPNTEDIFMHDTPDRQLFRRAERAFSSGCIRLEKPMELLDIALQGMAGWDRARIDQVLEGRQTTAVTVARPVPVRLHYTTVTVEGAEVRVRQDLYGLDEAYARALDAPRLPRVAELRLR